MGETQGNNEVNDPEESKAQGQDEDVEHDVNSFGGMFNIHSV